MTVWKKNHSWLSVERFRILVGRTIREKYREIPLRLLSRVLSIPKSTLSYKLSLPDRDAHIADMIRLVHVSHPYYGHRRIALELGINKKCTARIMKKQHIQPLSKKRRKWLKIEDRNFSPLPIPNLTKHIVAETPHSIWRSDFTHIYYRDEVLHLATIIDEYSKEIIAYKLSFKHKKELIIETLDEAVKIQLHKNLPLPNILHSDQGSEYRSYEYQKQVSKLQILLSYSKKSSPWQNSYQESFYGKFKQELWDISRFHTIEEAIIAIHHQIYYYNYKRIHTTIKMPPSIFAQKWMKWEIFSWTQS